MNPKETLTRTYHGCRIESDMETRAKPPADSDGWTHNVFSGEACLTTEPLSNLAAAIALAKENAATTPDVEGAAVVNPE